MNAKPIRIGELLVNKKLINPTNLEQCLGLQSASPKKLGEIVVEENLLSRCELEQVL